MKSITHQGFPYISYKEEAARSKSLWEKFVDYAADQQFNRLWWMALGILGHGTIFTIATLAVITLLGNIFALYVIACCAMVMVVVVNLAAMPTKITIPVFVLSLLIDIAVMITAILLY